MATAYKGCDLIFVERDKLKKYIEFLKEAAKTKYSKPSEMYTEMAKRDCLEVDLDLHSAFKDNEEFD